MTKSISNMSEVATEQVNTPGVMTPILEIVPTDGTELVFRNAVERGQQSLGIPIYMELYDSNGDPIPSDATVSIQLEEPADDDAKTVSKPRDNIRPYNNLSIQDQQNRDYVDRTKHVLKSAGLVVEDTDSLFLSIETSTEVDWSQSQVQIEESAVAER